MDASIERGPIMSRFISKGYHYASLGVCFLFFIIHLAAFFQLPDTIPYHWDIHGQADRFGSKYMALIWAVVPFILYLLLFYIPKTDRKKQAYIKHKKAYSIFAFALILFFSCISIVILLVTLGYSIPILSTVGGFLGILSIVMGNYMRQIRPNHTFGIKTPWALASELNWRKTHRLGSILFVLVGIWLLIGMIVGTNWWLIVGVILLILSSFILYLYSYILHTKETKK